MQAAGSWSVDACCAVDGNECLRPGYDSCIDRVSSSDWLFGLWPGPPQRFEPTGTGPFATEYQHARADRWPRWGSNGPDLLIGLGGAPGGRTAGVPKAAPTAARRARSAAATATGERRTLRCGTRAELHACNL
eukprot:COSAG04_NODE_3186_length_3075_cov_2.017809_2_plen_133_part_00